MTDVSFISPGNGLAYLNPDAVQEARQTAPPRCGQTASGYGARLPSSWELRIANRWHRVRVICWSNSGSAYVIVRGARLFLGTFEPDRAPRTMRIPDKGNGTVALTLRDGVVVGACGCEPNRFMGLTETQARHLARYGVVHD